jgi:hypothetical protein
MEDLLVHFGLSAHLSSLFDITKLLPEELPPNTLALDQLLV